MKECKKVEIDNYPSDWVLAKLDLIKPQISSLLDNSTKSSEELASIIIDLIKFDLQNTYNSLKDCQESSRNMNIWMETIFDKCKYHDVLGDFCLHPSNNPKDVEINSLLTLKSSNGKCDYWDCQIRLNDIKNKSKRN